MLNELIEIFEKPMFFSKSLIKNIKQCHPGIRLIFENTSKKLGSSKDQFISSVGSWNHLKRLCQARNNSPSSVLASVLGMFLCFGGGVKKHGFTRPKLNIDGKDDGTCIFLDMAIEFFKEGSYSILDTFFWGATKLDANLLKFWGVGNISWPLINTAPKNNPPGN